MSRLPFIKSVEQLANFVDCVELAIYWASEKVEHLYCVLKSSLVGYIAKYLNQFAVYQLH